SPFAPIEVMGRKVAIAQCNNVYIFPGIGLGVLAVRAKEVTDSMFLEAARILSQFSPALKDPAAALFPPLDQVRAVSREIAIGIAKKACQEKVAQISESEIESRIDALIWEPRYSRYT